MNRRAVGPGLYVHVPFCEKLCYYCDFNTYLLKDGGVDDYLSALEREIALYAEGGARDSQRDLDSLPLAPWAVYGHTLVGPPLADVTFATVFIGGGTPTALTASQLTRLLQAIRSGFAIADGAEITIEANPGTLIDSRLKVLRDEGVNRLSIGVQSLNDDLLKTLGRIHNARQARDCYDRARRLGFDNVSLDLMFGLPGQDPADWERTLTEVTSWAPDHLSCYGLIIERGTPFGDLHKVGRLSLPSEDDELAMYRFTMEHLAAHGYDHYEISNWAKPGRQSVHNRIYWLNGDWLGLGPGAHSQWGSARFANVRLPSDYAALTGAGRLPIDPVGPDGAIGDGGAGTAPDGSGGIQPISRKEAMEDTLILGLRLREGVSAAAFRDRFGVELADAFDSEISYFVEAGLLEWHVGNGATAALDTERETVRKERDRHLRLTDAGLLVANQVLQRFIR